MRLFLLIIYILSDNSVNSVKVEGFEFRDNNATTHITEENGVASINFLVGLVV